MRRFEPAQRLASRPARWVVAVWLSAAASASLAHDTWFRLEPAATRGEVLMALGTGNQYPVQESPVAASHLRRSGCSGGSGAMPLVPAGDTPTALLVRAPTPVSTLTCWAQLVPFDIELPPYKVKIYLREINAPPAVHEAWARLQARGIVWKERYTKHARIELRTGLQDGASPTTAKPVGMGMDVVLESGLQTIRPGDALVFQVLRDSAPLADFAVELRSDQHRVGLWRRTDAEGRVRIHAPLPGKWVLRGTDLRLSESVPDTWESRFVTLAFEIAPERAQNGSSLKSNARSENQTPAIATIINDPPTTISF
jgi:Domain of unknown function (DUF4198)